MSRPEMAPAEATDQTEPHRKRSRNRKRTTLPSSLAPRGLSREEASAHVGIGTTLFDDWAKGRKLTYRIGTRVLYCRYRIDAAIDEMLDSQPAGDDDAFAAERMAA
jgi:hypothetical protein